MVLFYEIKSCQHNVNEQKTLMCLNNLIKLTFSTFCSTVHPKEISLEGLPFFLSVAIYCYEGAGMILSLEASLHKDIRQKFRR